MTRLEDPNRIEQIVGATRHPFLHLGRAVSSEQRVYILHSEECRSIHDDLRDCVFSKSLDRGIDVDRWRGFEDEPVRLWVSIVTGMLLPERDRGAVVGWRRWPLA